MMRNPLRRRTPQERQARILEQAKQAHEGAVKTFALVPPEGVPLHIPVASISSRAGAQCVDFLITIIAAALLVTLFSMVFDRGEWGLSIIGIVATLIFFFTRLPYYIVTELVWNGRTLAKRWMGLRVISKDGRSLTTHQIVVRNVMKEVEFFAPITYLIVGSLTSGWLTIIAVGWTLILFIVPWRSKTNQRIGDIIANTIVIDDPKPILLSDLAGSQSSLASEHFVFTSQNLDHYGRFELQMLEQVLRTDKVMSPAAMDLQRKNMVEIAQRIRIKIGYTDLVTARDAPIFLAAFYRAQRAHLENRQLFGDQREDKFFNIPKDD